MPGPLDDLIDYLRYRTECGERTVSLSPESLSILRGLRPGSAGILPAASPGSAGFPPAASPGSAGFQPAASPGSAGFQPAASPREDPAPSGPRESPSNLPHGPCGRAACPAAPSLASIAADCAACTACGLCRQRTQAVPGQGREDHPDLMFVGEAPGADEDAQGLAFVGRAGQLLTKMIAAMGYAREEVFIANICKCRPPGNRTPTPEEMAACLPFLRRQIAVIQPKFIVALGNTALLGLLGMSGIMRLHGTWQSFEGIPVMPTFHPAYLLRLPAAKRDCWKDLQLVMARLH